MEKTQLILNKLYKLKKIYSIDESKKWNLRALISAINSIEKYNGIIHNGTQLKTEIKGIGDKIAKRIDEIIETGTLAELNENENEDESNNISNNALDNLLLITGVGLVRAKKWISLGIFNIDDLKKAISNNKIKSTHHIDIGIKYYEDFQLKIPRIEIDNVKEILKNFI